MTNVRGYTDKELLDRVKKIEGFKRIPKNYWLLGVASNENQADVYDDKFYLYHGQTFIKVVSGTVNTGTYGLLNFKKWNKKGTFVIKQDQWIYDFWKTNHMHKGKMKSFGQVKACEGYRDDNGNNIAEEGGKIIKGIFGINFHTVSYKMAEIVKKFIGGWSVGCQVVNDTKKYYEIIDLVSGNQSTISYCIIKEF